MSGITEMFGEMKLKNGIACGNVSLLVVLSKRDFSEMLEKKDGEKSILQKIEE